MSQGYTFSNHLSLSTDKWDSYFEKCSKNVRIKLSQDNKKKGFSVNKSLKKKLSGIFMLKKDHQLEKLVSKNNCPEIIQPEIDYLKKIKLRSKISFQLTNYKELEKINVEEPRLKKIESNKSILSQKMAKTNQKIIFPKLTLKKRYNSDIPDSILYNLVNINANFKVSPISPKNNGSKPNILKVENINKSSTSLNILSKINIMNSYENYLNTTIKIHESVSGNNSNFFLTSTKDKQINSKFKETNTNICFPLSQNRESMSKNIKFSNSFIRNSISNKYQN
jgi:hypothetical protein